MRNENRHTDSSKYELFFILAEISSALWVNVRAFETTLRTFMHDGLTRVYKSSRWWETKLLLFPDDLKDVLDVEKRLLRQKRKLTPFLIINNLSFTFWIELLSRRYHQKIWMKIVKFFPVYPGRRENFYNKAREIRNLRNAIAHHAPILRRNLIRDHAYLHELTALLDPHLADEVQKRSRVLDLLLNARLVGSGGGI